MKTCLSPDRNVLVQIWLSRKPELSGKCKISPVFNCKRSAARSPAKNNTLNCAWSRAKTKICEGSKDELCRSRTSIFWEITARSARRTSSAGQGTILDFNYSSFSSARYFFTVLHAAGLPTSRRGYQSEPLPCVAKMECNFPMKASTVPNARCLGQLQECCKLGVCTNHTQSRRWTSILPLRSFHTRKAKLRG